MDIQIKLERLIIARDLISKGWCRNDYHRGDKFCTMGALAQAAGVEWKLDPNESQKYLFPYVNNERVDNDLDDEKDWWGDNVSPVTNELKQDIDWKATEYHLKFFGIDQWNDSQRDKRSVIRVFNKTIERLKSEIEDNCYLADS